jgi:hypothetical protein
MEPELTLTEQTDKEFESAIDSVQEETAVTPETPPDKGTGNATPEPSPKPAQEPPEKPAPATEPPPAEKSKETPPETPETNYAGKYSNTFDLTHAVQEAAKELNKSYRKENPEAKEDLYLNKDLVSLFADAQKSNDWTKVEAKYKEFASELTKKREEEKKKVEPPAVPPVKEPESTVKPDSPEFDAYVNQVFEQQKEVLAKETRRRFDQTEVAVAMAQAGIEVPQTDEELTVLMKDNYGLWKDFTTTVKGLARTVREDAKNTLRLRQEAPIHNKSQVEKTKKEIEDFGKEWKKTFTPEEIDAILKEAEKTGNIYEDKSGVQMIRDGAFTDYFYARKAMAIIRAAVEEQKKAIEAENRNKGAVAAQEAFDKNNGKQIPQASSIPSASKEKSQKFDVGAAKLTAEDFDREADKILDSD